MTAITREEQIKAEAKKNSLAGLGTFERSFILGAEWTDSHPRWISVEDELPKINPNDSEWEYSDDVIVALKDGSIAIGRYELDKSIGEHYWVLYGVDKDLVVTHWMPLPSVEHLKKGDKE